MSNSEKDRGADVIEAPSTSVVLRDKINIDAPLDDKKQNWIDNKGNFSWIDSQYHCITYNTFQGQSSTKNFCGYILSFQSITFLLMFFQCKLTIVTRIISTRMKNNNYYYLNTYNKLKLLLDIFQKSWCFKILRVFDTWNIFCKC